MGYKTVACKICSKRFKRSLKRRVYCSIECKKRGRRDAWLKHSRTAKGRATQQRYRQAGKAKGGALKRAYNLTLKQHKQMYVDQNGCCKICKQSIPYDKIGVDHNHKTGKIRGLLCWHCNVFLGHLEKNFENLQSAIDYLK